jgi:RHS repeat-associated protein
MSPLSQEITIVCPCHAKSAPFTKPTLVTSQLWRYKKLQKVSSPLHYSSYNRKSWEIMPVTNYITVRGRIISEITDGQVLNYHSDMLGNVHMLTDQNGDVVKTMRYKPFGEVLSRVGSIADRAYQWVGSYGYRATTSPSSSHYVRARHYSAQAGSWTTVDPLWPDESAFGYVEGKTVRSIDPTGNTQKYPSSLIEKIKDSVLHGHCVRECKPMLTCLLFPITCRPGQLDNCLECLYPRPRKPRPPKLGGGNADYEPGWTPFTFAYGTCCGYNRACNCKSVPITDEKGNPDCVDAACKQHDIDNPTVLEYVRPVGHYKLCTSLAKCDCGSMYTNPVDRGNCKSAKEKIMALYCAHAVVLVPLPTLPPIPK